MKILDKLKSFFPAPGEMVSKASLFFTKNFFESFHSRRVTDTKLMNEGFLSNADFYSVVSKISSASRTIPIKTIEAKDSRKERIDEGETFELLKDPNPSDSTKDLIEKAAINILSTGDLFFWMVGLAEGFSFPQQIICLRSVCVDINIGADGKPLNYTYTQVTGMQITLEPVEVLHLKLYDPTQYGASNKRGLAPGQAGYNVLDASNELAIADAYILKNKGAAGFIASDGTERMSAEEGLLLQDGITKTVGGAHNKGKITVTGANAKFVQMSMSPTDLQIQEGYIIKLRQLCNIFNLDSSLFNDPANKRFNNQKEADKYLYTKAVIPLVERIIEALAKKLSTLKRAVTLEVDRTNIEALQADQTLEAEKNVKKLESLKSLLLEVKTGNITPEQAKTILQITWKLTEEEIQNIL